MVSTASPLLLEFKFKCMAIKWLWIEMEFLKIICIWVFYAVVFRSYRYLYQIVFPIMLKMMPKKNLLKKKKPTNNNNRKKNRPNHQFLKINGYVEKTWKCECSIVHIHICELCGTNVWWFLSKAWCWNGAFESENLFGIDVHSSSVGRRHVHTIRNA